MDKCNSIKAQNIGQPVEDRAMKMGAAFFGEELLSMLKVNGKIRRIAPTEQVYMNIQELLEDFNFEMEDGSWTHFEFESDTVTENDLRRFRVYEATISYQYKVNVTTYVICSAQTKTGRDTLETGLNTYRVIFIRLKDRNCDVLFRDLEQKSSLGSICRSDSLLLTPLMDGKTPIPERIHRSMLLLQQRQDILETEDLMRMESVLYAFATKFLTGIELNQIQEVFRMTILGQLLEQSGIEKGLKAMIQSCHELGISRADTLAKAAEKFSLTKDETEQYFQKYWD